MFQRARKHINPATMLAFVALIFAVTGASFAATGGGSGSHATLTATASKSKPKSKAGPRGPAGPKGATGATGPAGAAGPAGPAGASGAKGENGAAGVAGAIGPLGKEGPPGPKGEKGKEGSEGPQGPSGTTGFTKTLPSGETEKGTWSVYEPQIELTEEHRIWVVPISFSIPLKAGLGEAEEVHFLKTGEQTKACPGTVEEPKAAKGQFCLYQGLTELPEETGVQDELTVPLIKSPSNEDSTGTGPAGAIAYVLYKGAAPKGAQFLVSGSWAVTAP